MFKVVIVSKLFEGERAFRVSLALLQFLRSWPTSQV
jgi:stress-induced morphogen